MDLPEEMDFPQEEIPYAQKRISRTVRGIIGQAGLLKADIPDLEQEILLELLIRYPKFRSDRGHIRAFIKTIVNNKAASILKARKAAKREDEIGMRSLNEEFEDEDGNTVELQETISVDDYLRRTRGTIRTELERQDLEIDLRRVLSSLPAPMYAVCLLLIDNNPSEIANIAGLPRSTLRDLLTRLREENLVGSLRKYFK